MIGINVNVDRNTQRRLQRQLGGTPKQIREAFTFAFDKHKKSFLGHLRSAVSGRILRPFRNYAGPLSKALKADIESSGRGGELVGRFYVEESQRARAELLDEGGVWPKNPTGYMRIPIYDPQNPVGFINNKRNYPGAFRFYSKEKDKFYTALRLKKGKGEGTLRILYVDTKTATMPKFSWFTSTVEEFFEVFERNVASTMKKYFRDNFNKGGG